MDTFICAMIRHASTKWIAASLSLSMPECRNRSCGVCGVAELAGNASLVHDRSPATPGFYDSARTRLISLHALALVDHGSSHTQQDCFLHHAGKTFMKS
jgi:hypothetical protein